MATSAATTAPAMPSPDASISQTAAVRIAPSGWQGKHCSRLARMLGAVLAMVVALGSWLGWAQASLAVPSAGTADSGKQVRVLGHLPMQLSGTEQREFEARTLALAKITRAQDGVINYSCNADIEHPGTYVFDEVWPSEQALADHLETAHFKDWWAWVEPHLDGELNIDITATSNLHPFG